MAAITDSEFDRDGYVYMAKLCEQARPPPGIIMCGTPRYYYA